MVAPTGAECGISSWTEFDGERMHFAKTGSGPPLLLLHGLLGGSFCWRYNVPELARFHTTYAVDLHGLGLADAHAEADCSMQAQAKRLRAFIESTGLAEIDVVGSSWGGAIALLLAARTPAVRSLVLAAPVNPWSDFGVGRVRFCASRFGGLLIRSLLPFSRRFHHIGLERMYADPARIRPGTLEGYSALLARRGRARSLVGILRAWDDDLKAVRAAISHLRIPTLLFWGSSDRAVDPRSAECLQKRMADCQLEVLPDVGHLPFEESPEVFNRLVLDFVERRG
jgi:pimeloyl-ACP methyl ester carboxylesterase